MDIPIIFKLGIIFATALFIALADALIKMNSVDSSFSVAIKSIWMVPIIILYLAQVMLVVYLFLHKIDLGIMANIFIVFYSMLSLFLGYLMFSERLTPIHGFGIVLALSGVILMNI